jgi:hypothetical protein
LARGYGDTGEHDQRQNSPTGVTGPQVTVFETLLESLKTVFLNPPRSPEPRMPLTDNSLLVGDVGRSGSGAGVLLIPSRELPNEGVSCAGSAHRRDKSHWSAKWWENYFSPFSVTNGTTSSFGNVTKFVDELPASARPCRYPFQRPEKYAAISSIRISKAFTLN